MFATKKEDAHDFGKTALSELPGASTIMKSIEGHYRDVGRKRALDFLEKVNSQCVDSEILRYIEQNPSLEALLYDFVESVRKTPSKRARHALAYIYAECIKEEHISSFQAAACKNLQEINDQEIDLFIELSDIDFLKTLKNGEEDDPTSVFFENEHTKARPYPLFFLAVTPMRNAIIPRLNNALSVEDVFELGNSLIARGMLLPNSATGSFWGSAQAIEFGVGEKALNYRKYLLIVDKSESNSNG